MFETARLPLIQTAPRQIGHSDADGFRHLPKIAGVGAAYVLQSDGKGGSFWGPVSGASVAIHNSLSGREDANCHTFQAIAGTLLASQFPALTGDVATTAGGLTATLASIVIAGSAGSASVVPIPTWDAKGRITSVTTAPITPAAIGALPAPGSAGNAALFLRGDGTWSNTLFGSGATLAVHVAVTSCNSGSNRVVHNAAAYGWGHTFQGNGVDLMDVSANLVTMSGDLTIAGCKFRDDVFSSTGYAIYPAGVTPSNTNAALYFAKNGTVVGISGSGSASLSINGSPVATATSAGLSIPSLAGGGMVRAAAGGLLQIAVAADLPGGPYLPLTAGSSKVVTGTLHLANGLQCSGYADLDDIVQNGDSVIYGDIVQSGRAGHTTAQLLDLSANSLLFSAAGNGGIRGRTNGLDAESGDVGECITSALSNTETVSITATSIFDMTSIELPAGDWDVDATIIGKANIAAAARFRAAISTSAATIVSDGRESESSPPTGSAIHSTLRMTKRITTPAPITVYLSAQLICSSFGAASCWGNLSACRRR